MTSFVTPAGRLARRSKGSRGSMVVNHCSLSSSLRLWNRESKPSKHVVRNRKPQSYESQPNQIPASIKYTAQPPKPPILSLANRVIYFLAFFRSKLASFATGSHILSDSDTPPIFLYLGLETHLWRQPTCFEMVYELTKKGTGLHCKCPMRGVSTRSLDALSTAQSLRLLEMGSREMMVQ